MRKSNSRSIGIYQNIILASISIAMILVVIGGYISNIHAYSYSATPTLNNNTSTTPTLNNNTSTTPTLNNNTSLNETNSSGKITSIPGISDNDRRHVPLL